jgi:hypothetical protein
MLKANGGPRYSVKPLTDEIEGHLQARRPLHDPMPAHLDYELRVKDRENGISSRNATSNGFEWDI